MDKITDETKELYNEIVDIINEEYPNKSEEEKEFIFEVFVEGFSHGVEKCNHVVNKSIIESFTGFLL